MQVNDMKKFLVSSGHSSPNKSMRLVSCGYELIFPVYTMHMFML